MSAHLKIKPVQWIGRTKEDLSDLHEDVRDAVGQALYEAQCGGKHQNAKPLSGFGDACVLEIVADHTSAIPTALFILSDGQIAYMCCMFLKRSRSQGSRHHKMKWM